MATSVVRFGVAGLLLVLAAVPAVAQDSTSVSVPDSSAGGLPRRLVDADLENVSVVPGDPARVAFEDRRDRHVLEGLGTVRGAASRPVLAFVRRRGETIAAIATNESAARPRFQVRYPSDP